MKVFPIFITFSFSIKIKAFKNCEGPPNNPPFGGTWTCENNHHSSCKFNALPGFTCTNGVTCNTRTGVWRRRVQCRFSGQKPSPPVRPNGKYECRSNGKCKFVCENGKEAGRMFYDKKNGEFIPETNWYFCCPERICQNGIAANFPEIFDDNVLKILVYLVMKGLN